MGVVGLAGARPGSPTDVMAAADDEGEELAAETSVSVGKLELVSTSRVTVTVVVETQLSALDTAKALGVKAGVAVVGT